MNNESKSTEKVQKKRKICPLCKKPIDNNDLLFIEKKNGENQAYHFDCYLELQDKICAECGIPFENKEEVLYCEEHHEYFHKNPLCLNNHLEKHKHFQIAIYSAVNNQMIFQNERYLANKD
ncbi:MAG: hypothetical protein U9O98_05470 [Asgard group archaeon]|nr:hypothetical protein [Asgard group archaeon]